MKSKTRVISLAVLISMMIIYLVPAVPVYAESINTQAVDSGVRLEWAPVPGALYYRVYRSRVLGEEGMSVTDFAIDDTVLIDVNVDADTTYYYSARAIFKEASAITGERETLSDATEQRGAKTNPVILGGNASDMGNATKNVILMRIDDPDMSLNGLKSEIDPGRGTVPQVLSSRTYVPIRAIIEAMGGNVGYEDATKKISLTTDGHTVEMWLEKKDLVVDGKDKEMDVAPVEKNGRTMVPVRFAAENVGCIVDWIGSTSEIVIVFYTGEVDFDPSELPKPEPTEPVARLPDDFDQPGPTIATAPRRTDPEPEPATTLPEPVPADPNEPVTEPKTTMPATTQPGTTQPATTQPATTQPGTTQPATTQPTTTQPTTTKPATTQPATTQPTTTKPATTQPTTPVTTAPAVSEKTKIENALQQSKWYENYERPGYACLELITFTTESGAKRLTASQYARSASVDLYVFETITGTWEVSSDGKLVYVKGLKASQPGKSGATDLGDITYKIEFDSTYSNSFNFINQAGDVSYYKKFSSAVSLTSIAAVMNAPPAAVSQPSTTPPVTGGTIDSNIIGYWSGAGIGDLISFAASYKFKTDGKFEYSWLAQSSTSGSTFQSMNGSFTCKGGIVYLYGCVMTTTLPNGQRQTENIANSQYPYKFSNTDNYGLPGKSLLLQQASGGWLWLSKIG